MWLPDLPTSNEQIPGRSLAHLPLLKGPWLAATTRNPQGSEQLCPAKHELRFFDHISASRHRHSAYVPMQMSKPLVRAQPAFRHSKHPTHLGSMGLWLRAAGVTAGERTQSFTDQHRERLFWTALCYPVSACYFLTALCSKRSGWSFLIQDRNCHLLNLGATLFPSWKETWLGLCTLHRLWPLSGFFS